MQWQGDGAAEALVGVHTIGAGASLMRAMRDQMSDMQGYIGSSAFAGYGRTIAVTSPRGSVVQLYDAQSAQMTGSHPMIDVCGVAAIESG